MHSADTPNWHKQFGEGAKTKALSAYASKIIIMFNQ